MHYTWPLSGGIYISDSSLQMNNVLVYDNASSAADGTYGGIYVSGTAPTISYSGGQVVQTGTLVYTQSARWAV